MILVPRSAPQLKSTLSALQSAALTDFVPLALSEPVSLPVTLPATTTALILTSPLAPQKVFPGLPAYCVGDATADAARRAGMHVTYPGTNNGEALAEDILHFNLRPQHFVHLHGDHAEMAWHHLLHNAGHTITPVLAYQTRRILALPEAVISHAASLTHTLLFSAGSASHLANLMKQANITPIGTAVALSPAVALAATGIWPQVVTASMPTLPSMVATLRRLTD